MRGVEDPQLRLLVVGDVGDELDARALPGRPAGREDGPPAPIARTARSRPARRRRPRSRGAGAGRRPSSPGPSGRPWTRGTRRCRATHADSRRLAVLGEVERPPVAVAGPLPGRLSHETTVKGLGAGRAPADEGLEQEPRQGPRRLRVLQVVQDLGTARVERAAGVRRAVPVLGHRDRHDRHRRVRQARQHRARRASDATSIPSSAPTGRTASGRRPPGAPRRGTRSRCPPRRRGRAGDRSETPHTAPDVATGAQHGVRVDRLVRAVEHARADVRHGGTSAARS